MEEEKISIFSFESSICRGIRLKILFVDFVEDNVYVFQRDFIYGVQYIFNVVIGCNVVLVVREEVNFVGDMY